LEKRDQYKFHQEQNTTLERLELYGTSGCHLCDEALGILERMGIDAAYIDISGNEELMEKYGMRIPVLKRKYAELDWPFYGLEKFLD
jgi:hypothetical protein